jgi:hypothetical protein
LARQSLDVCGRDGVSAEVAETGDAYFFRAGHALIYEADTEALELNPAAAPQVLMDHIEASARARAGL